MSVEVTPEYIAAVVEHRRGVWGEKWFADVHEHSLITGDIAALLTHLHANPRVPSDEEVEQIRKAVQLRFIPEALDVTAYWREWAVEFQRHQFAPRKADVPDVVKSRLWTRDDIERLTLSQIVSMQNEQAPKLFELGLQMGKAK